MKRNSSSSTSLADMGLKTENGGNLDIIETGEEGTLDYRLRFAMAEHAHRCILCVLVHAFPRSSYGFAWHRTK